MTTALLSAGGIVNAANKTGQTPLHYAASKNHLTVLEQLIGAGGILDTQDSYGDTPLHRGISKGNVKIVEELIRVSFMKENTVGLDIVKPSFSVPNSL